MTLPFGECGKWFCRGLEGCGHGWSKKRKRGQRWHGGGMGGPSEWSSWLGDESRRTPWLGGCSQGTEQFGLTYLILNYN